MHQVRPAKGHTAKGFSGRGSLPPRCGVEALQSANTGIDLQSNQWRCLNRTPHGRLLRGAHCSHGSALCVPHSSQFMAGWSAFLVFVVHDSGGDRTGGKTVLVRGQRLVAAPLPAYRRSATIDKAPLPVQTPRTPLPRTPLSCSRPTPPALSQLGQLLLHRRPHQSPRRLLHPRHLPDGQPSLAGRLRKHLQWLISPARGVPPLSRKRMAGPGVIAGEKNHEHRHVALTATKFITNSGEVMRLGIGTIA